MSSTNAHVEIPHYRCAASTSRLFDTRLPSDFSEMILQHSHIVCPGLDHQVDMFEWSKPTYYLNLFPSSCRTLVNDEEFFVYSFRLISHNGNYSHKTN